MVFSDGVRLLYDPQAIGNTTVQTALRPAVLICLLPLLAAAQTNIALGGIRADPTAPVEITADSLTVDQASGQAVFAGNVLIGQGDLRTRRRRVEVIYDEATGDIARLRASGGVTFVTADRGGRGAATPTMT